MLGFGALGETSLGGGRTFSAKFDVAKRNDNKSIIQIAAFADRALIERLYHRSGDLQTIDRRKFEEVVAEIFSGFGYLVELTQRTRDGGKDIIAIKNSVTPVKYLIECKRPNPGNPVSVSTVRELYGVKSDDQATKAILVTTTYLTPDAKRFVEKHRWELDAKEFHDLTEWIAEYLRITK
jgi:HJR/Mrr/RecB family endonuclease